MAKGKVLDLPVCVWHCLWPILLHFALLNVALNKSVLSVNVNALWSQEEPRVGSTPLAMLAATCNKIGSSSPSSDSGSFGKGGFHPWKRAAPSSCSLSPFGAQRNDSFSANSSFSLTGTNASTSPFGNDYPVFQTSVANSSGRKRAVGVHLQSGHSAGDLPEDERRASLWDVVQIRARWHLPRRRECRSGGLLVGCWHRLDWRSKRERCRAPELFTFTLGWIQPRVFLPPSLRVQHQSVTASPHRWPAPDGRIQTGFIRHLPRNQPRY